MTLTNIEAEASVIGAMMIDGGSMIDTIADRVSADAFSEPLHGLMFDTLVNEHSLGHKISPFVIKDRLGDDALEPLGGFAYLARLTGDPSALFSPVENAGHIATLARRRSIHEAMQVAARQCENLNIPLPDVVSECTAALDETSDHIHQPTGGQCLDELIEGFKENDPGVTCGCIPCVDDILGPMKAKQLVIGAGRPGMGKTAFALSYAIGAARKGHGVLFVSLEMSSRELAARMASDLCFDRTDRIPFADIRDGTLSEEQTRLIARAGSFMHGLPFQVVDAGSLTTGRLASLIRRHARRMEANGHKLELVIVDYLQLLSPDVRARSNYEAVSEVSRALKAMAKDQGIAMMALAQLSREVEKRPDKRPQLSDLRDSGQIEQDADAVLFLLRPEYYLRQDEPHPADEKRGAWEQALNDKAGQIEFIVAKRRNGVTGNVTGRFYGPYQAVRGS